MAPKKSRSSYIVGIEEKDGDKRLVDVRYSGLERKRARQIAEKLLEDDKATVCVWRVSRVAVLDRDSLTASLPRDAF